MHVYEAERPELFFKSTANRVIGPGGDGRFRGDSKWNVPEAELTLMLRPSGEIFGLTLGDDLSSRDLEGTNALYLPQAKIYTGSCVMGPCIIPVQDVELPLTIRLEVHRNGRRVVTEGISTDAMVRRLDELASWLFAALDFSQGAALMTGTGIVPDDDFTLQDGDRITIECDPIGRLEHSVRSL